MDSRPIGIFDSGLGGLTAVKEAVRRMPGEDIVFFGDTGRVPYGTRSTPTIIRYAMEDMRFLKRFDIKTAVVACGTVSTTALPELRKNFDLPIYGVTEAAVDAALRESRSGRIGVIGTNASIRSGTYERLLKEQCADAEVVSIPCPLLVPLVENGRYEPGDSVTETVVAEYLAPMKEQGVDTLMLGCTHYPLLRPIISDYMGDGVSLVDVGEQCARWVADQLSARGLRTDSVDRGSRRFFVSDSTGGFGRQASIFLGEDVTADVKQIDITIY